MNSISQVGRWAAVPTGVSQIGDYVAIIVSRDEVNAQDTSSVMAVLKPLMSSPEAALNAFERFDISFHGYDDVNLEIYEIPEVRQFIANLDQSFPYWLFFLTKKTPGLQAVTLCFLPPFLTPQARERILPQRLADLLSNRWFPAMEYICRAVGFSEDRIEQLTNDVADYYTQGPVVGVTRT
jgi:hypothetical protein